MTTDQRHLVPVPSSDRDAVILHLRRAAESDPTAPDLRVAVQDPRVALAVAADVIRGKNREIALLRSDLAEIDRLAEGWTRCRGLLGGAGRTLHDITRRGRTDGDPAA